MPERNADRGVRMLGVHTVRDVSARQSKLSDIAAEVAGWFPLRNVCRLGPGLLATGFLCALALGLPATAQAPDSDPPPQSDMTSTLRVYARLTVVDVTVTDAHGQPVRGLTKDDFIVEEDGKPQPVRSFQEYGAGMVQASRPLPQLPPHIYTNLQPAPTTSAVNVLLLDALNTGVSDQIFVKQEMIKYLKNMPPGTKIAIFGLSSRLRILQGFTTDPAILLAAINTKKNSAMPSPFSDTDTGESIDSIMDILDAGTAASLQEFENEQNAFQADVRNRMTLEALNQIAAYLSGMKGRKNLIWFTGGIPFALFPSGGVDDLASMTDFTKDLRKTTDLLTAAQVAVYPVDARGLVNNPANSAVNGGRGFASGRGDSVAVANQAFVQKTGSEHLSMEAVAEATGGVAYYNTNGLKEAVSKAINNGSNYYSVSYAPPNMAFNGAYHSITIKVKEKGLHLAYRKGYYADDVAHNAITPGLTLATSAPEPYGNNMQASMGRGVPTSTQLLFDVRVEPSADAGSKAVVTIQPDPAQAGGETAGKKVLGTLDPKLKDKPLQRYDFQYIFPGRQITFSDGPNGSHKGSLEFDIAAYDVYGKMITSLSQTLDVPLRTAEYQQVAKSPFRFFQQIDLPPGEMFVRVGVLDKGSDKVGTVEIPLTVSKKRPSATSGGSGGK